MPDPAVVSMSLPGPVVVAVLVRSATGDSPVVG